MGIIEGIAESLASLLKVFSGYLSDKFQNKKLLAFTGYATSLFYKLALLLVGSWAGILGAMVIDRFGKGIRTAPRDVLVSESAEKNNMGKSFGLHKALIAGVERAFVAEIAPTQLKGTMLGLHSTVTGIALLPASVIAGVLWNQFGVAVPFIFGAVMSLLAAGILLLFMKDARPKAA